MLRSSLLAFALLLAPACTIHLDDDDDDHDPYAPDCGSTGWSDAGPPPDAIPSLDAITPLHDGSPDDAWPPWPPPPPNDANPGDGWPPPDDAHPAPNDAQSGDASPYP